MGPPLLTTNGTKVTKGLLFLIVKLRAFRLLPGKDRSFSFAPLLVATPSRSRFSSARKTVASFAGTRYCNGHGLAFQISAAYSAMVRSLENLPEPATFKMALRDQPSVSAYNSQRRWSASR